jgi:hypothetical protein
LIVSRVTLVTVPALTLGDLLLWHWALAGSHDVFALISGLTLPPLLIASVWLLVIAAVRLLARGARRPFARVGRRRAANVRAVTGEFSAVDTARAQTQPVRIASRPDDGEAPSRKIAA